MLNWKVILAIVIVLAVTALIWGGASYIYFNYFAKYTPAVVVADKLYSNLNSGRYTAFNDGKIYYYDSRQTEKGMYVMNEDGGNPELILQSDYPQGVSVNSANLFYYTPIKQTIYKTDKSPSSKVRQARILPENNDMLPKYMLTALCATDSTLYALENKGFRVAPTSNIQSVSDYTAAAPKTDGQFVVFPFSENSRYCVYDNTVNQAVISPIGSRLVVNIKDYIVYSETNRLLCIENAPAKELMTLPDGKYSSFHSINEFEFFALSGDYKEDNTKQENHNSDSVIRINTQKNTSEEVLKTRWRERVVAIVNNKAYVMIDGYLHAYNLVRRDYESEYKYKLPEFGEKDTIVFEPCGDFIFVYNSDTNELLSAARISMAK